MQNDTPKTPRTNAARLSIESGDWRTEKDCTNYALDLAAQLEMEAVTIADSHGTLLHEAMEMSDELEWAKQHAADALRERDAARTRAKDYFDALELAAKERDELLSRIAAINSGIRTKEDVMREHGKQLTPLGLP